MDWTLSYQAHAAPTSVHRPELKILRSNEFDCASGSLLS